MTSIEPHLHTTEDWPDGDLFARLRKELQRSPRLVVAFSGGADSSLLAWAATSVLGAENVLCATAISASLADWELADVKLLASEWKLNWLAVETTELADEKYVRNDHSRCFHCKSSLMDALVPMAQENQASVALGVNLDDLKEYRPGQQAALERDAVFPLVQAGLTKSDIRVMSKQLGLRTWDKPAAACLASRVPHGTPVTVEILSKVSAAEKSLRDLGFGQLRVRHYGKVARIELQIDELARALELRQEVIKLVRDAGYESVTLDLEGFRSGNLSQPRTVQS